MGNEFIKQRTVNMNEKYIIEQYNHTKNDFNDVWKIESQYFNPKMISPVSQVINWDNKNKDIHIFVKDKNTCSVVGEITLLPLTKKQYENFITNVGCLFLSMQILFEAFVFDFVAATFVKFACIRNFFCRIIAAHL